MTNLEWIKTLSAEELADWFYDEWLPRLQYRWSSSRGGLIIWLKDCKAENNSEKPNNYCDDCLYTDTCDSKEFFYACTSKATISKMEQVDKDINVRSKDEPQTDAVGVPMAFIDEAKFKAHCLNCQRDVADIKCLDCDGDKYFLPDEPQTDCSWR